MKHNFLKVMLVHLENHMGYNAVEEFRGLNNATLFGLAFPNTCILSRLYFLNYLIFVLISIYPIFFLLFLMDFYLDESLLFSYVSIVIHILLLGNHPFEITGQDSYKGTI